jgi:NADH-quinone oxidoreductase subunit B
LCVGDNPTVPSPNLAPAALRFQVAALPGRPLNLNVASLGLACCAVEVVAAMARSPSPQPADGPVAEVLVVAGTVTDSLAASVLGLYRELRPDFVVSFGACSNTGGPYWDSYSVTKGVDQLIPVDIYVPGCPPRPEALLHALTQLVLPRG